MGPNRTKGNKLPRFWAKVHFNRNSRTNGKFGLRPIENFFHDGLEILSKHKKRSRILGKETTPHTTNNRRVASNATAMDVLRKHFFGPWYPKATTQRVSVVLKSRLILEKDYAVSELEQKNSQHYQKLCFVIEILSI